MKKVFSNMKECIHIFASQSQQEGKSSSVFFEGKSLYSYGYHYELARFLSPSLVVISHNRYSSSTGRHINIAERALSHIEKIRVYQITSYDKMILHYTYEINDNLRHAAKALSKREDYLALARCNYEEISVFFSHVFPDKIKLLSPLKKLVSNIDLSKVKKLIEKEKQEERKLIEYREKSIQDKIALWIAGKNKYSLPYTDGCYLRIKNDFVETSQGAAVSLREAKILYSLMQRKSDINGFKIGNYTVISYIDGILKIGCHLIPQSEIDRISPFLKGEN